MKTLIILSILLGAGYTQHHLLGDIPSKIHMEIFGSPLRTPFTFPRTSSTPPGNSFSSIPPRISFPVSAFPSVPSISPFSQSLHHPINFDYRNTFLQNFTATQSQQPERIPQANELFAPAIIKTPAATKGQIKAYMKALQEEAEQELKDQMKQEEQRGYLVSDLILEPKAVSYVNVKLGGMQNVKYHYLS